MKDVRAEKLAPILDTARVESLLSCIEAEGRGSSVELSSDSFFRNKNGELKIEWCRLRTLVEQYFYGVM